MAKRESEKKSLFFRTKKPNAAVDPNLLHVESPLLPRYNK